MLTHLIDRWCALTPLSRALGWGIWSLCLAGFFLLASGGPSHENREPLTQLRLAAKNQWWAQHPAASQSRQLKDESGIVAQAFSPLDFQWRHTRLIRWLPTDGGGEMTLRAVWEDIPDTFARLAERNVRVTQFSLAIQDAQLHLTLTLERNDDG